MGNDAGFAAAVTIRQSLLHNKLTATYANGAFPSTLAYSLPDGPPDASVSFFLGEPDIACEETTNLLVITVPVWGGVTVTETDPATGQIKGLMEITIVPDFLLITAADKTQSAQLNPLTTIAVRTWTATVTSTDPPPDVASYVTGDMFRARLESAIVKAVAFGAISLPQIPVDYLHGIPAFVDERGIASVAVDGALLLGFSTDSDGQTGALSGDVTALTDFAGSFDLAAFVNPLAAPLFFSDVQDSLAKAATSAGDALDTSALSIVLADGHAHVTGKIDATGATLNFSFDVIPNMANYSGREGSGWPTRGSTGWTIPIRVQSSRAAGRRSGSRLAMRSRMWMGAGGSTCWRSCRSDSFCWISCRSSATPRALLTTGSTTIRHTLRTRGCSALPRRLAASSCAPRWTASTSIRTASPWAFT